MADDVEFALDELDGSDFEAIRGHSATLRTVIATLRADLARLEEENRALAAGSCDVAGGKFGDERGNSFCSLQAKLAKAVEGLDAIATSENKSANGFRIWAKQRAKAILKELRP